jgi:signal transduction histidine kinase
MVPGMNEVTLKNIFRPFFTTKTDGSGTGLGMSMVKDIIAQHHGDIKVESSLGEYTRFVLTIPFDA